MYTILLCTIVLSFSTRSVAWGALGHETVAYIAEHFLTPDTKTFCQHVLGNQSDGYLAGVATWADSYRRQKGGEFSAPFHFIDAEDSPPSACNVDYERDCAPEGPLHNEAIAVGGNQINVTFDGAATNLHAAWDTSIPEKMNGGEKNSDAFTWSKNLTQAIENGVFVNDKAGWLSGMDINNTIASALVWASDANTFVCSAVIPQGVEAVETVDLGTEYYQSVIDTVELQIARAGYRLAAWLNLIATGELGLQKPEKAGIRSLPSPAYSRGKNLHSAAKFARREFGHDCHCGQS